jgi:UDP-glucose 4-epimerase
MRDGFRLAITGATGDFGRSVLDWACGNDDIAEVTALGRRPTGVRHDKVREARLDLSGDFDLYAVSEYDALVHLAYCVEEPHDKRRAYQVNVAATQRLLEQAREVGIGQLVLTSSANALGVAACGTGQQYVENSYPAGDQDDGHYYFQHKALLEHLAHRYWSNGDGKTTLTVMRPCYVVGEHFDNSGLQTMLAKSVVYPNPSRSFYQFLWDGDLVDAYAKVLARGLGGLFNVAPSDRTSVPEICAITGARLIPGPLRLLKPGADLLFRLRLSPFSSHWVTLGDPLLDSNLLQSTTDWRPSMSSAAALQKYLATRPRKGRS